MSSENNSKNSKGISKPLIWWILFGVSCILLFTPVPTWIGVIAIIVTFIGALVASGEAAAKKKKRLKAIAEEEEKRLKALGEQGDVQAQYDLACSYQKRKKWNEAIPLFEQAAKAGHAQAQQALIQAQYDLACWYRLLKKWNEAIPLFEPAANQGLPAAQYELGFCYMLVEDDNMAFQWFEKAAEQGHADAQCQLGICYLRGDGVDENRDKAIEWCKKAMQNGSSSAEAIVGIKGIEKFCKKQQLLDNELLEDRTNTIRTIAVGLIKKGYKLECCFEDKLVFGDHWRIKITVFLDDKRKGDMVFNSFPTNSSSPVGHHTARELIEKHYNNHKKFNFNHIIHLDGAGILIESDVPWKETPPEWMVICGNVLSGYKISYPEWVTDRCQDAMRYVNVVFK